MARRWVRRGIVAAVAAILAVAGWYLIRRMPPRPPLKPNAVLEASPLLRASPDAEANAVVLAALASVAKFGSRTRGNWVHTYILVEADVLRVESGDLSDAHLRFVTTSRWPTPESGIMIYAAPFPWVRGMVYRFGLDTAVRPYRIVSATRRSSLPPYGKPVRRRTSQEKLEGSYDEARSALRGYFGAEPRGVMIEEETDACYVLRALAPGERPAALFVIDRSDGSVREAPLLSESP
jgi:hypothetical protein